jgi:cullin-associated NEDD8-dissociated protein 1
VESEQFDSLVDAGPLLAPEFQIFTPQFFINYVRLMSNLITVGAYYPCGDNKVGNEVRYVRESGTLSPVCTVGRLRWRERATLNETVSLLDLLLTGQRMTPQTRETVVRAYESASEGSRLQAAQRAVVLSAEFNTFGNPLASDTVRTVQPWVPPAVNLRPYKALVYFHMGGGADTHNLVVPMSCEIYDEYVEARTNLALTPEEVLMISATGQRRNCSTFGIHGALPVLKTLYDEGDAAFFVNVGGLVRPLTMGTYRSSQRCMGLFSHSAQTTGAQTLKCQESGTGPRGFGGRIADALASGSVAYQTYAFSVGGTAVWPYGFDIEPKLVADEVNSLEKPEALLPTVINITTQQHGNVFAEAYVVNFLDAVQSTESDVRLALERASAASNVASGGASGLVTDYVVRNSFEGQLKTVATFISMRQSRGAERDFFYVSFGGWDNHRMMKSRTSSLFGRINGGLEGFVAEMKAQAMWDSVLFVSASEFARTLDSNGDGSDHAWGANHFIVGGALNGGNVFNKYLEFVKPGSPRDLGRGRFIPEYPWESVAAPIAEWMGVEASQMETVFPNIGNFDEDSLISASDLFVAGNTTGTTVE